MEKLERYENFTLWSRLEHHKSLFPPVHASFSSEQVCLCGANKPASQPATQPTWLVFQQTFAHLSLALAQSLCMCKCNNLNYFAIKFSLYNRPWRGGGRSTHNTPGPCNIICCYDRLQSINGQVVSSKMKKETHFNVVLQVVAANKRSIMKKTKKKLLKC